MATTNQHPITRLRVYDLDLTQEEFAEIAGVDQSAVSKWESAKNAPSKTAMRKIIAYANAKGVKVDINIFW